MFNADEEHNKIYDKLKNINSLIISLQDEIKLLEEKNKPDNTTVEETTNDNLTIPEQIIEEKEKSSTQSDSIKQTDISEKQEELERKIQERINYENIIKDFNLVVLKQSLESDIANRNIDLTQDTKELELVNSKIEVIEKVATPTEPQKKELATLTINQKRLNEKIELNTKEIDNKTLEFESLDIPLKEKYTNKLTEFDYYLYKIVQSNLEMILPKVVFWENSNEYILQAETQFSEIISKHNLNAISRPLVNIFRICLDTKSLEDIKTKLNEIQNVTFQRSKISDILNNKTNDFIKSVWDEYDQKIKISLEETCIRIEIYDPDYTERSYYNMEERSQGCKTFLSFLLTIGAEAKQGVITNTILLLDEPEVHLHPSGVRYMLKELIKIANRGNIVFYATHSIFMIDRERIKRHFIIKKVDEKTDLSIPDEGNLAEEEVIFNAFGFSLHEFLNKKNIIFEGWRDKQLFRVAIENTTGHKTLKDKFKDIGKCHAKGVNQIKNITPILELAKRECLILSDNDEPAKRNQKDYKKTNGYGEWKRYDEIDDKLSAITGEDFIKDSAIEKAIDTTKSDHSKISSLQNPNLTHSKGKIFAIDTWLKNAGYTEDEERKQIMKKIKDNIFIPLKVDDIEPSYFEYLKGVSNLI